MSTTLLIGVKVIGVDIFSEMRPDDIPETVFLEVGRLTLLLISNGRYKSYLFLAER